MVIVSIPNKILILLKQDISIQLAHLLNLSFFSGSFQSILKAAKVVPVFKNGSKLDCCNYCPISPLSNAEKILEKLMYKGEYNFLTENKIICDLHFGFRQKSSASHALINLTENVRQAFDEGYVGCGIFVDSLFLYGYDSGFAEINCGAPHGSVLGPLLFLLYINYLNQAIKFCKLYHFADDTNLLYLGKSIKKLNKKFSYLVFP